MIILFFSLSHAQNSIFSKKYYNLNEDIVSKSVVATFDSSYLIAGSMNYKAAIIKVDSLGNFVWARHYSDASGDIFNSIVTTAGSGFSP